MLWRKICLVIVILSLTSGCGNRSIGSKIDDTLLVPNVFNQIEGSNDAFKQKDNKVIVSSYDGIVLITGQVANEQLKQQATTEALKVAGVKKLNNYLEIAKRVDQTTTINDALITSKLKTRFLTDSRIPASSIKIITENSTVYLLGNISREEGKLALNIASTFTDITKIVILFNYEFK